MAEPQLQPSIIGGALANGTEITTDDIALTGQVSGLADDRVLQEILRLAPYDGTQVYKAIIPYDYQVDKVGAGATIVPPTSTVTPSNHGDGSIAVNPFRAVVGSRAAASADPLKNWRDVRSGIFTGPGSSADAPHLAQSFLIGANADASHTRYDLVYATVTVDVQSNPVQRRYKDPSASTVAAQTVFQYLACTVTVTVLPGTPSATPAIPTLPADAAPSYNIALAAVRVVHGFNATSILVGADIRMLSTGVGYKSLEPGFQMEPATGNNDRAGTYCSAGTHFAWDPLTAGSRPAPFLPPDMVGGKCVLAMVDNLDASSANWSHPDESIVDDSIDWRNRILLTFAAFGTNPLAIGTGTGGGMPYGSMSPAYSPTSGQRWQMANSIGVDATLLAGNSTVIWFNPTFDTPAVAAGVSCGLYVNQTDGTLRWRARGPGSSANPLLAFSFVIFASKQMPNH
jgi:hypothetical protein